VSKNPFTPASSPEFVVACTFDDNHSDRVEVEPQCSYDLHFLAAKDVE
jgi:hypothetical protein